MENKKRSKFDYLGLFCIFVLVFGVGVLAGVLLQQAVLQASLVKFGQAFGGSNIEVNIDLNETQIVDRMYENMGLEKSNLSEREVSTEKLK